MQERASAFVGFWWRHRRRSTSCSLWPCQEQSALHGQMKPQGLRAWTAIAVAVTENRHRNSYHSFHLFLIQIQTIMSCNAANRLDVCINANKNILYVQCWKTHCLFGNIVLQSVNAGVAVACEAHLNLVRLHTTCTVRQQLNQTNQPNNYLSISSRTRLCAW